MLTNNKTKTQIWHASIVKYKITHEDTKNDTSKYGIASSDNNQSHQRLKQSTHDSEGVEFSSLLIITFIKILLYFFRVGRC